MTKEFETDPGNEHVAGTGQITDFSVDDASELDILPEVSNQEEKPTHVEFLASVVANHLRLVSGSFGDESARQQICQALRIAGKSVDEKRFIAMINSSLKSGKSDLIIESFGRVLALTRSGAVAPLDTLALVVDKPAISKARVQSFDPVPSGNIAGNKMKEQSWWDANFK